MFFDILNPFHWIRTIVGLILIITILLIPGWKAIFGGKTIGETWQIFKSNPIGYIVKAFQISFFYYLGIFQKSANQRYKNIQKDIQEQTLKFLKEQKIPKK